MLLDHTAVKPTLSYRVIVRSSILLIHFGLRSLHLAQRMFIHVAFRGFRVGSQIVVVVAINVLQVRFYNILIRVTALVVVCRVPTF